MAHFYDAFKDNLTNIMTGLGGRGDKARGARWSQPFADTEQLVAAFRGDSLARKGVIIPAFDMVRAGWNWQADNADIEAIEALQMNLQLAKRVVEAKTWARLFGGAAIILGYDRRLGAPNREIDLEEVSNEDLKYLHVVTKDELKQEGMVGDPSSEYFGQAEMYKLNGKGGNEVLIHPSRVVPFYGNPVPRFGGFGNDGWGDSVLLPVSAALKGAGMVLGGIDTLVSEAKIDVFRVKDFAKFAADPEYNQRLLKRFELAAEGKSIINALILDFEEEYSQKAINFSGLTDLAKLKLMVCAAAFDIPATRYLSQSPDGMNASGDSDMRNYYDKLDSERTIDFAPSLNRILEPVIRSSTGKRDPSTYYEFAPLWQETETERSENRKRDAETVKIYVDTGTVPHLAISTAVQNSLIENGTYPGLEAALAETEATVGLASETFKTLIQAWDKGALPAEVLYDRLNQAGMLPVSMTFEAFKAAIEAEKAAKQAAQLELMAAKSPGNDPKTGLPLPGKAPKPGAKPPATPGAPLPGAPKPGILPTEGAKPKPKEPYRKAKKPMFAKR